MIAYVLPTRDRPGEVVRTLARLGAIEQHRHEPGEVIVVDNASRRVPELPDRLPNTLRVRLVHRNTNEGAAARNAGVRACDPRVEWVVMLDDDSAPIDGGHLRVLRAQPAPVGAVSADIFLEDGAREQGGLPEVFVGCGVAIRRELFERLGGYDPSFGYYAEEYDLSAGILMAGLRVAFEPCFRVMHRKVAGGRDMDLILGRLVRNNGWVLRRYCPDDELDERLGENESRYRAIAAKENAVGGFERGLAQLHETIDEQVRTPMDDAQWARFTGLAHAREALSRVFASGSTSRERERADGLKLTPSAQLIERGKNAWAVERALHELGIDVVESKADARIIGTMSPGPMLDAATRNPDAILPWINSATRPSVQYRSAS